MKFAVILSLFFSLFYFPINQINGSVPLIFHTVWLLVCHLWRPIEQNSLYLHINYIWYTLSFGCLIKAINNQNNYKTYLVYQIISSYNILCVICPYHALCDEKTIILFIFLCFFPVLTPLCTMFLMQ